MLKKLDSGLGIGSAIWGVLACGVAAVEAGSSTVPLFAQAAPPGLGSGTETHPSAAPAYHPAPSDPSLIYVLYLGVTVVGSHVVAVGMKAYQDYRAVTDQSKAGQLSKALAEIDALKAEIDERREAHKHDLAEMRADFETRLEDRDQDIENLRKRISSLHAAETERVIAFDALQARVMSQADLIHEMSRAKRPSRTRRADEGDSDVTPAPPK